MMRCAPAVLWADSRLHRLSRGRWSLLGIAGLPSLRLTTVGRRSGVRHTTGLLYFPDGDTFVVVGSNWGRPRDPDWAFNLRAEPDATVTVGGVPAPVRAREVRGEAHAALWRRLLEFWPGYGAEARWAGRELPVFVLAPRP